MASTVTTSVVGPFVQAAVPVFSVGNTSLLRMHRQGTECQDMPARSFANPKHFMMTASTVRTADAAISIHQNLGGHSFSLTSDENLVSRSLLSVVDPCPALRDQLSRCGELRMFRFHCGDVQSHRKNLSPSVHPCANVENRLAGSCQIIEYRRGDPITISDVSADLIESRGTFRAEKPSGLLHGRRIRRGWWSQQIQSRSACPIIARPP